MFTRGDDEWLDEAACRDADPELFFATDRMVLPSEKERREAEAKTYCARCPVRRECLKRALATQEPHGVWGGLNELERRALRRRDAA